jgi:hypothetical protein
MPEDTIMVLVPETIVVLNLVLCVVILLLGYLVYRTRDIISALFIGISSYSDYRTLTPYLSLPWSLKLPLPC